MGSVTGSIAGTSKLHFLTPQYVMDTNHVVGDSQIIFASSFHGLGKLPITVLGLEFASDTTTDRTYDRPNSGIGDAILPLLPKASHWSRRLAGVPRTHDAKI
jgi:hypothetical protein